MNTTNVSFINFDPNINHLHLSVVCGNISSTPTREMFLEDWLSSYNVTDINENVNKTRMKRQVDPGISTEQYRSGVTLTYTCGVARRFQNSTDLYDERYVVKYLNENERYIVKYLNENERYIVKNLNENERYVVKYLNKNER